MTAEAPPSLDLLTVPLHGMQVSEASAGTGKTHTITRLFLRLVLEAGIEVDRILVVTYTVAATEELRERIRALLGIALASITCIPCSGTESRSRGGGASVVTASPPCGARAAVP